MKTPANTEARRPLLDALGALRDVPAAVGQAEDEARRRERIAAHIAATREDLEHSGRRRKVLGLWLAAALSLGGGLLFWASSQEQAATALNAPWLARPMATSVSMTGQVLSDEANAIASSARGVSLPVALGGLQLLSGELSGDTRAFDATQAETWTAAEFSRVRLDSEVELELDPDTRVQLVGGAGSGELVVLQGRVRVSSEGAQPAPVRIRTKTVRVDATGARFSVSLVADDTRVEVDSGSVRLERRGLTQNLEAGERWQQKADTEQPAAASSGAGSHDATERLAAETSAAAPEGGASPGAESSDGTTPVSRTDPLTEQNRMFETASLAKQRGLYSLALRRLDQLLAAYPGGALSENARVERFRILRRMGRTNEARVAARAYLGVHPSGFAKAEAESLITTAP